MRFWLRGASLFLVGAFVVFLATQAPHLVHHFFEPEHVQDECPFAANGERTGGLETPPVAVAAVMAVSTARLTVSLLAPPSAVPAASRGRAPPRLIS
jgi:hypothetical protein